MKKPLPTLALILLCSLSSCYCFKKKIYASPGIKYLDSAKSFTLCDNFGGKGLSTRGTLYYGAPSTDYLSYSKTYNSELTESFDFSTHGEFGGRFEHYFRVASPYPLLGIGVDYSYAGIGLDLTHQEGINSYATRLASFHHHINLSVNYITLVNGRSSGYIIGQIGLEHTKTFESSNNPNFISKVLFPQNELNYRIGYGHEYYVLPNSYFSIEAGYGGGGYVRFGVGVWLF